MQTLDARLTQLEAKAPPPPIVLRVIYRDALTGLEHFDATAPEVHTGNITVKGLRTRSDNTR